MKGKLNWQLKDVIMVAILGVVFAAVYMAVFHVGLAIQAILTPFGLGDLAFEFVYGIWFMAATLAAYIIQKPTVAFAAEVLASVMELFMGNAGGIRVVITGAVQGLGSEAGLALFRYKRYDLASLCVSGMTTAVFIFLWEFVQSGYGLLSPGLLAVKLAIRLVSACLFSGLVAKLAGDGLATTGVLKNYPLGGSVDMELADEED